MGRLPDRVLDQRNRNRLIDALEVLARGDEGVRAVWPSDYFEGFYDWVPPGEAPLPNSAISREEAEKLMALRALLDRASGETPRLATAEELIETGWPGRIAPLARETLALMLARGRLGEDREEEA